jgi:hypothetical protein
MSWLFFMDESGHDHKQTPLEVRGGIAIHANKLWAFLQAWQRLETDAFGARLVDYGHEAKGYKLLDKNRIKWAAQTGPMPDADRRKNARAFMQKGIDKQGPNSSEFAAYGQACLEMARGTFDLLKVHDARIFASCITRGVKPPANYNEADFLRKDHVFLFERFYYFLEAEKQNGLIIMDETEKTLDRRFVSRMESYFTKTGTGRNRIKWIVPAPLFVSSEMNYAIQAADICLYAINWGFRPHGWGDGMDVRQEIADEFGPKLDDLQWQSKQVRGEHEFYSYGIVHVADPYAARAPRGA